MRRIGRIELAEAEDDPAATAFGETPRLSFCLKSGVGVRSRLDRHVLVDPVVLAIFVHERYRLLNQAFNACCDRRLDKISGYLPADPVVFSPSAAHRHAGCGGWDARRQVHDRVVAPDRSLNLVGVEEVNLYGCRAETLEQCRL